MFYYDCNVLNRCLHLTLISRLLFLNLTVPFLLRKLIYPLLLYSPHEVSLNTLIQCQVRFLHQNTPLLLTKTLNVFRVQLILVFFSVQGVLEIELVLPVLLVEQHTVISIS